MTDDTDRKLDLFLRAHAPAAPSAPVGEEQRLQRLANSGGLRTAALRSRKWLALPFAMAAGLAIVLIWQQGRKSSEQQIAEAVSVLWNAYDAVESDEDFEGSEYIELAASVSDERSGSR